MRSKFKVENSREWVENSKGFFDQLSLSILTKYVLFYPLAPLLNLEL